MDVFRGLVQKKILPAGIILLLLVSFRALVAQSATPPPPPAASTPRQIPFSDPQFGQERNAQSDSDEVKREKEREKAMNKDRYASLKKDTDKLLQLATELKQSVDQATENKLSLEVIRKTEEVEKLAKKVRDKMKAN